MSATLSVASPAVEMTLAVVADSYVRATPGVNGWKAAAVPRVSASVAGTVPVALPSTGADVHVVTWSWLCGLARSSFGRRSAEAISPAVRWSVAVSLNVSRPRAISEP